TLELVFRPISGSGLMGFLFDPVMGLIAFVAIGGFSCYAFYLRKMLQHLDPSAVIPDRVKTMLNTLAEGVLVLDKQERVVLANDAFATAVGRSTTELQGMEASKLPWTEPQSELPVADFPWRVALRDGSMQMGIRLGLKGKDQG